MVNPFDYPNIKCDKCGHEYFVPAFVLKRIPGVAIGSGTEDQLAELPVYVCQKCGEIVSYHREKLDKLNKQEEKKETVTPSGIIL